MDVPIPSGTVICCVYMASAGGWFGWFSKHTHEGRQVQMKGNFQYWWAIPKRASKKRRPNRSQNEEKSQSIIRQNPKIYRRSLKTDFSVVELDDFMKKKSLVDCKNFLNINGLFRGFHQPFFFPFSNIVQHDLRFVESWVGDLRLEEKICDSHQVWEMNWWMGPVGLIKSSWPPLKQRLLSSIQGTFR